MCAGAARKANVGISNDNAGEKPAHRKTKDSGSTDIGRRAFQSASKVGRKACWSVWKRKCRHK